MTEPLDWKVCAVCGRVLDRVTDHTGATVRWQHAAIDKADHVVVPVSHTETTPVLKCDFCLADDPQWELPVNDFQMLPAGLTVTGQDQNSVSEWAACDICADLIRADDWPGLSRRAIKVHEQMAGGPLTAEMQLMLRLLHRNVRINATGPIRPLT